MTIAKTPLYNAHLSANGKMVDFHHWSLPLHYGSQLSEHKSVRVDAGIFDVSHMTIVDILGAGGRHFLRKLLTNDIDTLPYSGRALYSCMCNEHGGIIDDLIVYQRASDSFRLVLNSATYAQDLAWLQHQSQGYSVGLQQRKELAIVAIQGPNALQKTVPVLNAAQQDALSTLQPFECVDCDNWFIARTGYTGEDGLEIILPAADSLILWDKLLDAGVQPCGLAARDSLRLEAGLMLYGQDMDLSTNPLESSLAWTVKFQPDDRDFIGKGALLAARQRGVARKLVGLILDEKGVMRTGQKVRTSAGVGLITSGTYSAQLNKSIALARFPTTDATTAFIDVRGKEYPVRIGPTRFIKQGKIVWS